MTPRSADCRPGSRERRAAPAPRRVGAPTPAVPPAPQAGQAAAAAPPGHPRRPPPPGTPPASRRLPPRATPDTTFVEHAVQPECCTHCGSADLAATGTFTDHVVADLPEPKLEWHRYRRHVYQCRACQRTCQGRGDLELPGAHLGPRVRLLTCYARAHLGISLGKTAALLHECFGLAVSRAGRLGHLRWGGALFAPVVDELLERLRRAPVVQGDETGWRLNGQPAWAWCFRDPTLALFLIDRHRSRAVVERVLGKSFAGTLVCDFYAAYHGLACPKQRCLVHLLRELAKLRAELPWQSVRAFVQPWLTLFQDAIQLGHDRASRSAAAFDTAHQAILDRFDDLLLGQPTRSAQPDCQRLWQRLFKHGAELFTFLDDPRVPADNNGAERDIRSLAAARHDGGTHRAEWSAAAFAKIKSVVVTSLKNGRRFLDYGLEVVHAKLRAQPPPVPLSNPA